MNAERATLALMFGGQENIHKEESKKVQEEFNKAGLKGVKLLVQCLTETQSQVSMPPDLLRRLLLIAI